MKRQELRDALVSLRQEIDRLGDDDEATRQSLGQLADRMEAQLEKRPMPEDKPLTDSVVELVELYEARHPKLTAMVNDVMMRLASMGI